MPEKQDKPRLLTKEELKRLFGPLVDAMIEETREQDEHTKAIIQGILSKKSGGKDEQ